MRSRRRSPLRDRPGDRLLARCWRSLLSRRATRVVPGGWGAAVAREVDRDGVRRLMEQGAQIVDVLPAREYGEDHPPGAVNLPLREIRAAALRVRDPRRPVVVYRA